MKKEIQKMVTITICDICDEELDSTIYSLTTKTLELHFCYQCNRKWNESFDVEEKADIIIKVRNNLNP